MGWTLDSRYQTRARKSVIPQDISHIKNDMVISHLLKEIYSIQWCDVRSVTVREKAAQPGDITGNLSESSRVVVSLVMNNGQKSDHHWFVKIMPKQHKNADLMEKFNIFENEIGFYKDIAPDLLSFLTESGVKNVEFSIPKLLFAANEEDGSVIILEDVSVQGYSQERDAGGDRYLSPEKAELALDAIARIHAASKLYNMHSSLKLEEKHSTLRTNHTMWEDTGFHDRLSAMKDSYCEVLKKSSEHDSARLLKRFQSAFDSSYRLASMCAERYAPKETKAVYLQHGDFHFNNLLFKQEAERMSVMVVDWQLVYTGRSTGDVSYLLLSSISPELRQQHEQRLKESYFTSFNNYLASFESSVIAQLSRKTSETCGISFSIQCDSESDTEAELQVPFQKLERDYQESATLSLFLSCGNVLNSEADRQSLGSTPLGLTPNFGSTPDLSEDEREQSTVKMAYSLAKKAEYLNII